MTKKARMTTQDVIDAISDDSGDSDVDPDEPWNFGRNTPNQKFTPQILLSTHQQGFLPQVSHNMVFTFP